jgi:hypothetical protein
VGGDPRVNRERECLAPLWSETASHGLTRATTPASRTAGRCGTTHYALDNNGAVWLKPDSEPHPHESAVRRRRGRQRVRISTALMVEVIYERRTSAREKRQHGQDELIVAFAALGGRPTRTELMRLLSFR